MDAWPNCRIIFACPKEQWKYILSLLVGPNEWTKASNLRKTLIWWKIVWLMIQMMYTPLYIKTETWCFMCYLVMWYNFVCINFSLQTCCSYFGYRVTWGLSLLNNDFRTWLLNWNVQQHSWRDFLFQYAVNLESLGFMLWNIGVVCFLLVFFFL